MSLRENGETIGYPPTILAGTVMPKRYIVRLSEEEQQSLKDLVSTGKAAAYKIKHANILLNIDVNGAGWTDAEAATALSCHLDAEQARCQAEIATVQQTIAKLEATLPMAQTRETDFKKLVNEGFGIAGFCYRSTQPTLQNFQVALLVQSCVCLLWDGY